MLDPDDIKESNYRYFLGFRMPQSIGLLCRAPAPRLSVYRERVDLCVPSLVNGEADGTGSRQHYLLFRELTSEGILSDVHVVYPTLIASCSFYQTALRQCRDPKIALKQYGRGAVPCPSDWKRILDMC
jgi:hypothetical protein